MENRKFNCDEKQKEECCDPLNKTIRKAENIENLFEEKNATPLLKKDNPFEFWKNLPSPTEKPLARQDSTADSLTYSEDSADLSELQVSPRESEEVEPVASETVSEPSVQQDYVSQVSSPVDPFVEEPVETSEPVQEEKPKTTFSAYSNYFNLINKKN